MDLEAAAANNPQDYILRLELRLAQLEANEKRRNDFLAFVKHVWPDFIAGSHHKIIAEKFQRVASGELKRLIVCMPPRHAILTSMKIPTTDGMKSMQELAPGDFVFGPNGKPTRVLGKSEVFTGRQLYKVTTDDGSSITVDGEHLWTVRLCRKSGVYKDYTTEQLWRRQNGELLKTSTRGEALFLPGKTVKNPRSPRLPDVEAAQYPEQDLLVDPYVLGVWLGNGTKHCGIITANPKDIDQIRQEFEKRGVETTDQATPPSFGTLGLKVKLREIGVLNNKHIPETYLRASVAQRRDLLKGLMDTDGNVSKKGQCFFAQSNRAMIKQVAELIRSLGVKASILENEAKIGDTSYGPTWKVSFYASDIFTLERKEERTLKKKPTFGRYISIEKLPETGDTQCIKVDREDGLFLAGEGYICTHNTKSEFASYLLPAWLMGKDPKMKIIQATHTAELAVGFGRKVKNLIDSELYKDVFPETELSVDSKASGRWNTSVGGDYYALGVGGAMAGRGGNLVVIDDPHSEADAMSQASLQNAYEWYTSGPRQRLQPGGAIVVVMTRWGENDLVGNLLKAQAKNPRADQWEVIEFPAIMPSGRPCWPEFWSLKELMATKESIDPFKWAAQYQQNPTSRDTAILKREWWRIWDKTNADGSFKVPPLEAVIQSYDTAYSSKETADYSAITTWGIFYPTEDGGPNVILLDAKKGRWDFPELKRIAKEEYKFWEPETVIIEAKASGMSLTQEMRQAGIPVINFTPTRGNDKMTRVNSVAPILESGVVWAPGDSSGFTPFAEDLIHECAAFPKGENDDLVDTAVQAWALYRKGNYVKLSDDIEREAAERRKRLYY